MASERGRWLTPPARLDLARDEVHVWRAALDLEAAQVAAWHAVMAPDEAEQAARFRFERDRRRYIAGHGVLRAILGCYTGAAPAAVRFERGSSGKPVLRAGEGVPAVRFNMSASGELALYAVAFERELGVDVEQVRPMPDAADLVRRFYSLRERAAWQALPAEQQLEAFFAAWTRKEACVKAWGQGLSFPLDAFDVTLAPGEPAQVLAVHGSSEAAARWSLAALAPGPGYAGALVVEGQGWRLRCWGWEGGL